MRIIKLIKRLASFGRLNETGPEVLLVMPPPWDVDQPPLGIAYLTSALKGNNISVQQRDLSAELYQALPNEDKELIVNTDPHIWVESFEEKVHPKIEPYLSRWVAELAGSDAKIVGISVFYVNKQCAIRLAKGIKEIAPEKTIIFGGPETARYGEGLNFIKEDYVDYVVPDEGEESMAELSARLLNKNSTPIEDIKGVLLKKEGSIIDTGQRPMIRRLDSIPLPSMDGFKPENYREFTIPILASRGCINKCSFCSEHIYWKYYRFRSGESIYREFKKQSADLNHKSFYIVDSLINGNINELEKMCDLMIQDKSMEVYWGGKVSIRKEMTEHILRKMYLAGCRPIVYGIESASPKVLKDMNKNITPELASRVLYDSKKAGLTIGTFWIIGFPTESEEDFQMTLDFLKDNKDSIDIATPGKGCGILPGTSLHMHPEKYGIHLDGNGGWHSDLVNPEIISKRIGRFISHCRDNNIQIG